jgi:hypothetical protein
VRDPGTEVSASELGGRPGARGRGGVWAVLLRRRQEPMAQPTDEVHEADQVDEAQATPEAQDSSVPAT